MSDKNIRDAEIGDQVARHTGSYEIIYGKITDIAKSRKTVMVEWETGKTVRINQTKYQGLLLSDHRQTKHRAAGRPTRNKENTP